MAQFLEEPQLAQRHRMAEMNVDAGRVDAVLDAQRLAGFDAALQFFEQFVLRHDLLGAAADQGQLFLDGFHDFLLAHRFCNWLRKTLCGACSPTAPAKGIPSQKPLHVQQRRYIAIWLTDESHRH